MKLFFVVMILLGGGMAIGGATLAQTAIPSVGPAVQWPITGGLITVVLAFLGFLDRSRRASEKREIRVVEVLQHTTEALQENSKVLGQNTEVLRMATAVNTEMTKDYHRQTDAIVKTLDKIRKD